MLTGLVRYIGCWETGPGTREGHWAQISSRTLRALSLSCEIKLSVLLCEFWFVEVNQYWCGLWQKRNDSWFFTCNIIAYIFMWFLGNMFCTGANVSGHFPFYPELFSGCLAPSLSQCMPSGAQCKINIQESQSPCNRHHMTITNTPWPIRGQYLGHVISANQSEASDLENEPTSIKNDTLTLSRQKTFVIFALSSLGQTWDASYKHIHYEQGWWEAAGHILAG